MKQLFLNYSLNTIKQYNPDIDNIKMEELKYGLEGIYLTFTKLIFILILSIILNIVKETAIMLLIFNVLRITGFGLHATKSWICLISSSIIFILFPFLSKILVIPMWIKSILGIIAILIFFIYAPADTKKRPIIDQNRRNKYKFITTTSCIILSVIALFTNNIISNLILFGIYSEVIIILPITYHIFHLSYNNYKNYLV